MTPQTSSPDPAAFALKHMFQCAHGVNLEERDALWKAEEIRALDKVLELLPAVFVSGNANLKSFVREAEYKGEYEQAPGQGMYRESAGPEAKKDYVVLYDKAFYNAAGQLDVKQLANTIVHEVSHSLDDEQPGPYQDWLKLSGWFQTNGHWLPTRDLGFVDDYARGHPKEDFAETFTLYVMDPDRLRLIAPEKFLFMERLFKQGKAEEPYR